MKTLAKTLCRVQLEMSKGLTKYKREAKRKGGCHEMLTQYKAGNTLYK